MIAPNPMTIVPSLTIESVHGLKETIVVGPNGISLASNPAASRDRCFAQASSQRQRTGEFCESDASRR